MFKIATHTKKTIRTLFPIKVETTNMFSPHKSEKNPHHVQQGYGGGDTSVAQM